MNLRPFLFLALFASSRLMAADLLQIYREAVANDPTYAGARATMEAGIEKEPQGLAGMLPNISATGNTTMNKLTVDHRQEDVSLRRKFNSNGYTVTLTQPVFRWQNLKTYSQGKQQALQAEANFAAASQDLIVKTAQAYFDVLSAQDALAFTRSKKTAISEQLEQAKRNFEVGTATIVDTHEAQARADLAVAEEVAGQSDLENKQRALAALIGKKPDGLKPLRDVIQINTPQPNDMDAWVEAAQQNSFVLKAQQAQVEFASLEVDRNRAGHYPTIDIVATYGDNAAAASSTTAIYSDTKSRTVGFQVAIPLFAGGSITSKTREAAANLNKAKYDLEAQRRSVALAAQQAYLGVTSGIAQVRAYEAALLSSKSSRDSNKLGYEVGVRINIDVLNAQQQVFSTQRDLAKARYDALISQLKLKAAAGTLDEDDLLQINALLAN